MELKVSLYLFISLLYVLCIFVFTCTVLWLVHKMWTTKKIQNNNKMESHKMEFIWSVQRDRYQISFLSAVLFFSSFLSNHPSIPAHLSISIYRLSILSICLSSVYISVCLTLFFYIYLPIYRSIITCLSVSSICLCLSIHLLSIYISIYVSTYMTTSVCLSNYLS